MDPLGNPRAILSTQVLDTPAADPSPAVNRAALGEESGAIRSLLPGGEAPRAPRGGKIAPDRKTGVGAMRPDVAAEDAKKSSDFNLDLAQKGLGIIAESFRRVATTEGRQATSFRDALATSLTEMAKKEALAAVGTLPFAKAITKAITLSAVFADAAGKAIAAANAKLNYDQAVRDVVAAQEIDEETFRTLQFIRGWQRNSTAELEGILRAGLIAVVEKALEDLFGQAEEALSKSVKSVADQIAKMIFKHNEIFAVLNDVLTDQAKRIPATRARMERITFHTLAESWVKQFTSEDTQKRLAPILGPLGGKDPVHVGVLGGVLEVIFRGSYKEYTNHVPVEAADRELRALLMESARSLLEQARGNGVAVVAGTAVEVAPDRVTVPEEILKELDSRLAPPGGLRLLLQRVDEFNAAVKRLQLVHSEVRRRFQEEIYRADELVTRNPATRVDPFKVLQKRQSELQKLRDGAVAELQGFLRGVEREFGTRYDGADTKVRFIGLNEEAPYLRSLLPINLAPYRGYSGR